MKVRTWLAAGAAAMLAASAVGVSSGADAATSRQTLTHAVTSNHTKPVQRLSVSYLHRHFRSQLSCATAVPGFARCFARHLVPTDAKAAATSAKAISGLTPANIQSAYKLTGKTTTKTVAIVDAYGYPRAASDLATYRSRWGLPACTVASGCLKIVNQTGGTVLPAFNLGWAQEQALDLDAVSAACPKCKILLVQAKTPTFANLGTAVKTAAAATGVLAVSNSYGGGDAPDSVYGTYYNHPGVAVTASAGDSGYQGASYPASSHYVTAVGGTSLTTASNTRGWTEKAWSGTGSGCSIYNTPPANQKTTVTTNCLLRALNDVAADADPYTGLAVYAPTSSTASSWQQYGGTSLSSPIVASVYTLSGNTAGYANTIPYAHRSSLFDVTSGSNGSCSYWCTAKTGWDGPTGLGTPNGTAAF
jgi:subtilase family serine protease